METVIGFAAGYLAGTAQGKAGLERLRASVRAIATSPEAHRLAREAAAIAASVARRGSARGATATASGLAGLVIRRLTQPEDAR